MIGLVFIVQLLTISLQFLKTEMNVYQFLRTAFEMLIISFSIFKFCVDKHYFYQRFIAQKCYLILFHQICIWSFSDELSPGQVSQL